jgi:hypothetical protein
MAEMEPTTFVNLDSTKSGSTMEFEIVLAMVMEKWRAQ